MQKPDRGVVIARILWLLLLTLTSFSTGAAQTAQSAGVGSLRVVFLDVRQGDSALLQDVNGFTVLIDGGDTDAGPIVMDYLRENGISQIDVMVATHPDSDHIGGLIDVLAAPDITVGEIIYNGYPGTSGEWNNFLAAANDDGLALIPAQSPVTYTWGEMTAQVLNPTSGLGTPDTNDASVVLRVDHGEVNFLFTGDISDAAEADLLAGEIPVAAEVLKVAHHGSTSSSSSAFLNAVGALDSIISVGPNTYKHPSPDTLERLKLAGSVIWRTDWNGHVTVVSDGADYSVSAQYQWRLFLPGVLNGNAPPAVGNVNITQVFYDGMEGSAEPDEFVEIQAAAGAAVPLQGWSLSDNSGKTFWFPAYTMQPGQACRVYTNKDEPDWCGFNFKSGSGIWNNSGDCAILRDAAGAEVDRECWE